MKIKSNNTFKVNRKRLLKNAENIGLKFERDKSLDRKIECYGDGIKVVFEKPNRTLQATRGYGDKESYTFGSNTDLTAVLKDDILNLSLSSYGGICGFEFNEDDLNKWDAKEDDNADINAMLINRIRKNINSRLFQIENGRYR